MSSKEKFPNPWENEIKTRSKYKKECQKLHEIMTAKYVTINQAEEAGVSKAAFRYAMYHYVTKGIRGWENTRKREGREIAIAALPIGKKPNWIEKHS